LNGDKTSKNKFEVGNGGSNGTAIITPERPSLNFFNSSITDQNGCRENSNSTNTLGYDTGIVEEKMLPKLGIMRPTQLSVYKYQEDKLIFFGFFNSFLSMLLHLTFR
jgi:hypothetical protein